MADKNTDFLKFNAYSIKDLLIRKLSQTTKFSDQIYEGSNISLLINLVSYMYQCLTFLLNQNSSESMFSDTQIYENINRLVNLIGYQPKGCSPASFNVVISSNEIFGKNLPRYSYVDTGKNDRNGSKIYFSTLTKSSFDRDDETRTIQLYNGRWKMYNTIFSSSGSENETFSLNGLHSDSETNSGTGWNVAYDFIHVYVKDGKTGVISKWENDPNGIFLDYNTNDSNIFSTNNTLIYDRDKKIYTTRLTQDKTYEIQFGNGIVGQKLNRGDIVYIVYLDTNGVDGDIDLGSIDFDTLTFHKEDFGINHEDELYKYLILESDIEENSLVDSGIDYSLRPEIDTMSKFKHEESVDEIRHNAPNWLKTGNRLVTKSDYEYFIKNAIYVKELVNSMTIVDVKCMNNIEYAASFYKWLYLNGLKYHNSGKYYFDQTSFWNRTGYKLVDPADVNNTYAWIKSDEQNPLQDQYNINVIEKTLNEKLNPLKMMTTEIRVIKPVIVDFDICANQDYNDVKNRYLYNINDTHFDQGVETYIEITLTDDSIVTPKSIQMQVYNSIIDSFDINKCVLGQTVDINNILNKIYNIGGIKNVRTVYSSENDKNIRIIQGLSFASWSPILNSYGNSSDIGYDDLLISNESRKLEQFQFPMFIGKDTLMQRIKIISKQMTPIGVLKQ